LSGTPRIQAVPPDPAQLAALTRPTGGRVLQAQSSPQLDAALTSLLWDAGIVGEHHELTLLVAAAALLLLAIAAALTAAGRPAAAGLRRWGLAAGLLVAAATASLWTQWQPTAPPPAAQLATTAAGDQAAPRRAALPGGQASRGTLLPSSVTVDPALRQADSRIIEQATSLLYRLGELAEQRPAELGRPLSKSFRLDLTACESCKPGALSAPASYFTPLGADCEATLNLPLLKQQAKRAPPARYRADRPGDPPRTGAMPTPGRHHPGTLHRRATTRSQTPPGGERSSRQPPSSATTVSSPSNDTASCANGGSSTSRTGMRGPPSKQNAGWPASSATPA
jgi:hypothetical protein